MGYLPEERGLCRKINVRAYLEFPARLKGMQSTQARAVAAAWVERLDLTLRQYHDRNTLQGQSAKIPASRQTPTGAGPSAHGCSFSCFVHRRRSSWTNGGGMAVPPSAMAKHLVTAPPSSTREAIAMAPRLGIRSSG